MTSARSDPPWSRSSCANPDRGVWPAAALRPAPAFAAPAARSSGWPARPAPGRAAFASSAPAAAPVAAPALPGAVAGRRQAQAPSGARRRPAPPSIPALYALLVAVSLLALALIDDGGRGGARDTGTLFWLPLLAIVLPAAFRLLGHDAGARERLGLLLLLGLGLYVAKVLLSPAEFTFSDELSTLRSTADIARTGHLLTPNSIAVGFSLYPGVDLSALSVSQAGALPPFTAGLLVIGTARLILVLALFRLLTLACASERVASIGALVYVANPNFLFFDAQFSYESLALPLAVATLALLALALRSERGSGRGALTLLAVLVGCAVAPTHHITSYALLAALAAWTIAIAVARRRGHAAMAVRPVLIVLATTALAVLAWLAIVWRSTAKYLRPVIGGAVESTYNFLTGSGVGKTPFHSGGETNSPLEQALGIASVLALLVLLGIGLWRLRRERPASPLAWVLTVMAALYPVSLALRLTQAGSETSNRASEFLFLGLALVAGGVLAASHPVASARRQLARRLALSALVGLLFAGGVVIGWPPASRVPGRPLTEADARSVEPYDLAAARWAARHLPAGSLMIADRANGLLMSAYAQQNPLIGSIRELPFGAVITSPWWGRTEEELVFGVGIRYIVVDRRLAHHLPALGIYVDSDEPGANAHRRPLSPLAISKFERVPNLVRVYDNGEVEIYEVIPVHLRRRR